MKWIEIRVEHNGKFGLVETGVREIWGFMGLLNRKAGEANRFSCWKRNAFFVSILCFASLFYSELRPDEMRYGLL